MKIKQVPDVVSSMPDSRPNGSMEMAAATQQRAEQDKRLEASDQTHHEALTDTQKDQARLRDRGVPILCV